MGHPGGGGGLNRRSFDCARCASLRMTGLLGEEGFEGLEDLFEVADEGYVDFDVFVDFGGVDVDVDFFGVGGVVREVAGDAVVEAHAEGEEEVGLLDGVVDPGFAVHAHHAEVEGVGGGEGAEAEQRAGDGDAVGFGERDHFGLGSRIG